MKVGSIPESESEALRARVARLSDSELGHIVSLECGRYPTPSMLLARDELKRRGLAYPNLPDTPLPPEAPEDPEAKPSNPFAKSSLLTKVLFSSAALCGLATRTITKEYPRLRLLPALGLILLAILLWSIVRDAQADATRTAPAPVTPAGMPKRVLVIAGFLAFMGVAFGAMTSFHIKLPAPVIASMQRPYGRTVMMGFLAVLSWWTARSWWQLARERDPREESSYSYYRMKAAGITITAIILTLGTIGWFIREFSR